METIGSHSVQHAASQFGMQHLELAPGGWRQCVEKIAEGYAEVVGEHVYCLNCGGVLQGAQGHDIDCVTMFARRMLANEALIHACSALEEHAAALGIEYTRPAAKAARQTYHLYNRPRVRARRKEDSYVVPTFLNSAQHVRTS